MAYSTNNSSSTISVTNFGVKLDGITDNKNALQRAINSVIAKGGGELYFPNGNCYWSGTLDVTGRNIGFVGNNNSFLSAATNESNKKINISGSKNIYFDGLTFDAGKTTQTSSVSNQLGFINTINSENIRVTNCNLQNTFNSLIYLGGGTRFVNISNNYFSGHFCGIYSYINVGEAASECFTIDGNRFGASWCSGSVAESACIKLQTSPGQNNQARGHTISNNNIDSTMQMGVELWSLGRDNTISNNTIENTVWGISLDGQQNSTVVGNTIKQVTYAGLEIATNCKNNILASNTVNGFLSDTGGNITRNGSYGIVLSNVGVDGNMVHGNYVAGFVNGIFVQGAQNTVVNDNVILDCQVGLDFQGASLVKVHGNTFQTGKFATSYHIFFDASSSTISGFHFTNNKFRGRTTDQSIFYYNNGTAYQIRDVCFENNVTDGSTVGGYGIFIGGQLTPVNYVYRNNFGPSGADGTNSIQDAADSSSYTNTAIQNGFQYYGRNLITIPNSGVVSTSGAWVLISSGDCGGTPLDQRFAVRFAALNPPYTFDGCQESLEFSTTVTPYGQSSVVITAQPHGFYAGNVVAGIAADNPNSDATSAIWLRIRSGSIGTSGYQMYVYSSDSRALTTPTFSYNKPNFTSQAKVLDLWVSDFECFKTTRGIGIGTGYSKIYSPSSGELGVSTSNLDRMTITKAGNIGIGTLATNPTVPLSFGTLIANTHIGLYDDTTAPGYLYGLGIAGNIFRLHVDYANSRFGFYSSPAGTEVFTVLGTGMVGVGISAPTAGVHIKTEGTNYNSGSYFLVESPNLTFANNATIAGIASIRDDNSNYNLFKVRNSGSTKLLVRGDGQVTLGGAVVLSGIATTTTATAGGAALPANPLGFITIGITGGTFKIPYYSV